MTYTSEILVQIPIRNFINILNNPELMEYWQRGFTGYDYISGIPGDIGAKMKLTYKFGKLPMELIETVTHKKWPNAFHVMYYSKNMQHIQENYFEEMPKGFTKWTAKNEFIPSSFKLRMMLLFMPKEFKKQIDQYMQDFKNFAENGTSVSHEKT